MLERAIAENLWYLEVNWASLVCGEKGSILEPLFLSLLPWIWSQNGTAFPEMTERITRLFGMKPTFWLSLEEILKPNRTWDTRPTFRPVARLNLVKTFPNILILMILKRKLNPKDGIFLSFKSILKGFMEKKNSFSRSETCNISMSFLTTYFWVRVTILNSILELTFHLLLHFFVPRQSFFDSYFLFLVHFECNSYEYILAFNVIPCKCECFYFFQMWVQFFFVTVLPTNKHLHTRTFLRRSVVLFLGWWMLYSLN